MNKVIIIGNLTKDPEIRNTKTGKTCASLTVAVDRKFKNADGKHETDFFPVVAWGRTGELCAQYLVKGNSVGIEGRIQTRSYEAQDGTRRYVTEIVADEVDFLTSKYGGQSKQGGFDESAAKEEIPF
jgi:single-strand DNA-binding protein